MKKGGGWLVNRDVLKSDRMVINIFLVTNECYLLCYIGVEALKVK